MTSLALSPGLTLLAGRPGCGKTNMLTGLGEEFMDAGHTVYLLTAGETASVLNERFGGLPFGIFEHWVLRDIEMKILHGSRGDAILIDGVEDIPNDDLLKPLDEQPVAAKTRTILAILRKLDADAKMKEIFLVGTIQTPRSGQLSAGVRHAFPIAEIAGGMGA